MDSLLARGISMAQQISIGNVNQEAFLALMSYRELRNYRQCFGNREKIGKRPLQIAENL